MPSPIQSILRAATRERGGKLNILTFPTHERYESNLCQTGHNFFSVAVPEYTKPGWDTDYAAIPENYPMLANINDIPIDMDFDLVLSQNKFGQFEVAKSLSQQIEETTSALAKAQKEQMTDKQRVQIEKFKSRLSEIQHRVDADRRINRANLQNTVLRESDRVQQISKDLATEGA